METALIVSSTDKGKEYVTACLKHQNFSAITTVCCGVEARVTLGQKEFDLVVINAPLKDETGADLSLLVAQRSSAGVILIVKADMAEEVSRKVEQDGVFVLPKPLNRKLLAQAFKLVAAARKRFLGLQQQNIQLQQKIEDIRLVDRAKYVLIEHLKLSEPQAHRFIEKQAMDRQVSKREVAERILNTYSS